MMHLPMVSPTPRVHLPKVSFHKGCTYPGVPYTNGAPTQAFQIPMVHLPKVSPTPRVHLPRCPLYQWCTYPSVPYTNGAPTQGVPFTKGAPTQVSPIPMVHLPRCSLYQWCTYPRCPYTNGALTQGVTYTKVEQSNTKLFSLRVHLLNVLHKTCEPLLKMFALPHEQLSIHTRCPLHQRLT